MLGQIFLRSCLYFLPKSILAADIAPAPEGPAFPAASMSEPDSHEGRGLVVDLEVRLSGRSSCYAFLVCRRYRYAKDGGCCDSKSRTHSSDGDLRCKPCPRWSPEGTGK